MVAWMTWSAASTTHISATKAKSRISAGQRRGP